ncbi:MAG: AraC family transcriptional regulator [Pseudomonadota bacterium]
MSNTRSPRELQAVGRSKAARFEMDISLMAHAEDAQLVLLKGKRGAWEGMVRDLNHVFLNLCLTGHGEIAADYTSARVRGRAQPGVMGITPKSDGEGRWPAMEFAILGISPDVIDGYFAAVGKAPPSREEISGRAAVLFRDPLVEQILVEMIRAPEDLDGMLGAHGTGLILHRLFQRRGDDAYLQIERGANKIHPLTKRQIQEIDDFIDAHMSRKVTTDELASIIGVSRFHFSRRFAAKTGEPPHRYLTRKKLLFAAQIMQLSSQEVGVTEIAAMIGYDNPSSFARAFASHFGMPPTSWRRANKIY